MKIPDNEEWYDDEDEQEASLFERWEPLDDEVENLIDSVDFNED